jgi:hypothetical protein
MTQPVPGPAYYFPFIEKKYGRPINEWIDLIRSSELTPPGSPPPQPIVIPQRLGA